MENVLKFSLIFRCKVYSDVLKSFYPGNEGYRWESSVCSSHAYLHKTRSFTQLELVASLINPMQCDSRPSVLSAFTEKQKTKK